MVRRLTMSPPVRLIATLLAFTLIALGEPESDQAPQPSGVHLTCFHMVLVPAALELIVEKRPKWPPPPRLLEPRSIKLVPPTPPPNSARSRFAL
jgi:hypothetical protein